MSAQTSMYKSFNFRTKYNNEERDEISENGTSGVNPDISEIPRGDSADNNTVRKTPTEKRHKNDTRRNKSERKKDRKKEHHKKSRKPRDVCNVRVSMTLVSPMKLRTMCKFS